MIHARADIDRPEVAIDPPEYNSTGSTLAPSSAADFMSRPRRPSIRPGGGPGGITGRSLRPAPPVGSNPMSGGGGPAQIQLLSIPQLDIIQRTLKILDVRLQHVQTNVKSEEKTRQDIQHIRTVMSENQKALATVVSVLGSLQDEVINVVFTRVSQPVAIIVCFSTTGDNRVFPAGSENHKNTCKRRIQRV